VIQSFHNGQLPWTGMCSQHDKVTISDVRIRVRFAALSVTVFCLLILACFSLPSAAQTEFLIGVRAHSGMKRALDMWQPTADYLTEKIPAHKFTIAPYVDFQELRDAVANKEVDFVLTNSAAYVELELRYGVSRLVTLINKRQGKGYTQFGGVIFIRADRDDIRDAKDLKGKSFMAVDQEAFGGWWMQLRELRAHGIDPYHEFTELRFGDMLQQNVVFAVRDGEVDAGAVRTDKLERMAAEGTIKLSDFRVIQQRGTEGFPFMHSTQLYPEWPFAKAKHTAESVAKQVAITLLTLPADSEAARSGQYVGWTVPLNYQPVHELMKELRVGPYENYGRIRLATVLRQYWHWLTLATGCFMAVAFMVLHMRVLNKRLRFAEKKLKDSNQALKNIASMDGLTGIPNRRKLDEYLKYEWRRARRYQRPISVILIDIDYFKAYNDTYGHLAGDDCLKRVAATLKAFFKRSRDITARFGGEEFMVVLPDTDREENLELAERLRCEVEALLIEHRSSAVADYVTISVGAATTVPDQHSRADSIIAEADQALYLAKANGRNRVESPPARA